MTYFIARRMVRRRRENGLLYRLLRPWTAADEEEVVVAGPEEEEAEAGPAVLEAQVADEVAMVVHPVVGNMSELTYPTCPTILTTHTPILLLSTPNTALPHTLSFLLVSTTHISLRRSTLPSPTTQRMQPHSTTRTRKLISTPHPTALPATTDRPHL